MGARWRSPGILRCFPTRSPGRGAAGCAACWVDGSGHSPDIFGAEHPGRGGAGADIQFPAASAPKAYGRCGQPVSGGGAVGLCLDKLRRLRRGHPAGESHGAASGRDCRRADPGAAFWSGFSVFLAGAGVALEDNPNPRKKIFAICENFVCIWGKMGYNKME